MDSADIICIKWGTKYNSADVNRLRAKVAENVYEYWLRFHCFTDDARGLDAEIHVHPLPHLALADPADLKHGYLKEAGLCADDLGGLKDTRVLFLDLDVVVTGPLDDLIAYPQGDEVVMIDDWNTPDKPIGQASCLSWRVGTLGTIRREFETRPREIVAQYGTACQEWLSERIRAIGLMLRFWPKAWRSFKFHALPHWTLRRWVPPRLPENCRVLVFHGEPKMADALAGRWSVSRIPVLKRIYKTLCPTPWLADYWLRPSENLTDTRNENGLPLNRYHK
jgi:hypothetical protein